MARITNKKAKTAKLRIVNCHIYENQYEILMKNQIDLEPLDPPKVFIDESIKTLDDVINKMTPEHLIIEDYNHRGVIKYPFSV